MEEANAVFLNALLAKHGSIVMQREHFWELPLYLENGMLPIVISIPPYHFWEPPPEDGPSPTHGSDFGLFILAEVLGMSRVIFVKDEDGLYDEDPKKHPDAKLIQRIDARRAPREHARGAHPRPPALHGVEGARVTSKRVQIVNGLAPGQLTRALAGEEGRHASSSKEGGRCVKPSAGSSRTRSASRALTRPARTASTTRRSR